MQTSNLGRRVTVAYWSWSEHFGLVFSTADCAPSENLLNVRDPMILNVNNNMPVNPTLPSKRWTIFSRDYQSN